MASEVTEAARALPALEVPDLETLRLALPQLGCSNPGCVLASECIAVSTKCLTDWCSFTVQGACHPLTDVYIVLRNIL